MIISHKHKFIFIEVGKTGSTSIASILKKYASPFKLTRREQQLYHKHIPAIFLKEKLSKKVWDNYFRFAFVRNPWDWAISTCGYRKDLKLDPFKKITSKEIKKLYRVGLRRGITWEKTFFQVSRITDKKGALLVDFVGRFENIQQDFGKICDRIGIPREKLPHLLKTSHKHYSQYYDQETKALIAKLYQRDIKFFNYHFVNLNPFQEKVGKITFPIKNLFFVINQLVNKSWTYLKEATRPSRKSLFGGIFTRKGIGLFKFLP